MQTSDDPRIPLASYSLTHQQVCLGIMRGVIRSAAQHHCAGEILQSGCLCLISVNVQLSDHSVTCIIMLTRRCNIYTSPGVDQITYKNLIASPFVEIFAM